MEILGTDRSQQSTKQRWVCCIGPELPASAFGRLVSYMCNVFCIRCSNTVAELHIFSQIWRDRKLGKNQTLCILVFRSLPKFHYVCSLVVKNRRENAANIMSIVCRLTSKEKNLVYIWCHGHVACTFLSSLRVNNTNVYLSGCILSFDKSVIKRSLETKSSVFCQILLKSWFLGMVELKGRGLVAEFSNFFSHVTNQTCRL